MLMQIHTECNLTFRGLRTCIVTHLTELKVKQAKSFLLVQKNQEKLENDNTRIVGKLFLATRKMLH